jgi:hypothetical protein
VLGGSLDEWIFVADAATRVTHILDFRKFEPLVWSRVAAPGEPGAEPVPVR